MTACTDTVGYWDGDVGLGKRMVFLELVESHLVNMESCQVIFSCVLVCRPILMNVIFWNLE